MGLMTAALVAYGGSDDTPAQTASTEGFWSGTASTGYDVDLVVLENGETWGVYSSGDVIYGALAGKTSTSGDRLSGSGLDFNLPDRSVTQGTYSGTVSTKESISVTLSNGSSFEGTYDALYEQPASSSAIVGDFSGPGVSGAAPFQTVAVTIEPSGQMTMHETLGCSGSGTIKPRASGKNVYDLSLTFSGATCTLGNGMTVRGIAVYDSGQVMALALNADKSDGFIYWAEKVLSQ